MTYGVDLTQVPPLQEMIRSDELAELCTVVTTTDHVQVWVTGTGGARLWGTGAVGVDAVARPIMYAGEELGVIHVAGERAAKTAAILGTTIELLAHQGFARYLSSATHEATMDIHLAELSERNARLERAVRRMADVDRLKSTFLATMSHELRTPLTAVIGYAEMLNEGIAGPVSSEQREYLQVVLSKADQLLQLINALLDVSTVETSALTIDQDSVRLEEVVRAAMREFEPHAHQRLTELVFSVEGDYRVIGDKAKLRLAIGALISNAIKFSPEGSVIRIDLAGQPPTGEAEELAFIKVTDRGIGIPASDTARIFEPFFQVDSSSTRAYGGSGLGLALTRAYVESHGGKVRVDSQPGEGSVFTIQLPAVSVE